MAFELPALPILQMRWAHIDHKPLEIHHGKHHNAYVTNLNKALKVSRPTKTNRSKNC
jgi:Fe-Mn family superoxide dismutase